MNSTEIKESTELNSIENENNINFSPDVVISQITEYFQGRISKDISDMVGHIVNTLNSSGEEATQIQELLIELEKYKCIIRIQQSLIQLTNNIHKSSSLKE